MPNLNLATLDTILTPICGSNGTTTSRCQFSVSSKEKTIDIYALFASLISDMRASINQLNTNDWIIKNKLDDVITSLNGLTISGCKASIDGLPSKIGPLTDARNQKIYTEDKKIETSINLYDETIFPIF